ncbi:MAG: CARDB domain-containing protein [Thermoplasmata archaeon]
MLANRLCSKCLCLAVMLMLLLPGVHTFMKETGAKAEVVQDEFGNLVINGTSVFEINSLTIDPLSGETGKYGMKGNITVQNGGTLIIRNAELYFLQDIFHHYWLSVKDGGKIIMENAQLTVSTSQLLPYVLFNISMTNAGDSYINNSKIAFPGYFNVSGSNLTFINSNLSAITPPSQYQEPSEIDTLDDGPVLKTVNSRIVFINSSIDKSYQNAYANAVYELRPLYKGVSDNTTNANTGPLNFTDGNYYVVGAGRMMHIQNFDTLGNTGNVLNAWLNITYRTDADYISPTVMQISFDGGVTWQDTTIAPNNRTTDITETYTIGATTFGNLSNLQIRYQNLNDTLNVFVDKLVIYAEVYIGVNERDQYDIIFENTHVIAINTYFDVDFLSSQNPEVPKDNANPQHNRINLRSNSFGYFVNITVNESQSQDHADTPILTDATSEVYLYRWLDVILKDAQNLPVSGAYVNVSYNGIPGEIQTRVEKLNNMSTAPHAPYALTTLGRTVANYNITNESGFCSIPLVTDNISAAFWPNSMPYGNYRVFMAYNSANGTFTSTHNLSFSAYPNITGESNRRQLNISLAQTLDHPDLTLSFTMMPAEFVVANTPLVLNVSVSNVGTANATHFRVVFYEGHPLAGGTVFASVECNQLAVGQSVNLPSQMWTKATAGKYKIVIVVDANNEVYELEEQNNLLIHEVVVYREGADLFIDGTPAHPNRTLKDINPYIHAGFIIIKGNGNLTLDNTTLNVSQVRNYQYQIIVSENGSLYLTNNARIAADKSLMLSIEDNGALVTRKAAFENLTIMGHGNAVVDLKDSLVESCLLGLNVQKINLENVNITLNQQQGSVYLSEDFESDTARWSNYTIPARNGSWEAGTPKYISPHSGNVSFGTELLDKDRNGKYENSTTYVLVSPEISLIDAPNALLEYYQFYKLADDVAIVEITEDGTNWKEIARYTGLTTTWTKATIDISQYVGNLVKIRFTLVSNASQNDIGWYIDDIIVAQRYEIHASQFYGKDILINENLSELSSEDVCTLINATLPESENSVLARDNAIAKIYRYLVVNVTDLNGQPVSGAIVEAYGYLNGTLSGSASTGANGFATLTLLTDIINATTYQSSYFVGMYTVKITFGSEIYWSNISFKSYPYWENTVQIDRVLTTPLPDLSVWLTGLPSFVSVGSTLSINVSVNNTGNAYAPNAEIVVYDVIGGNQNIVGRQTVGVAGSSSVNLQFNWTPSQPGIHKIIVLGDPNNNITESNEGNNSCEVDVTVFRPSVDLVIINTTVTLTNMYYICSGMVYIENGSLILINTTFKLTQTSDFSFGVYINSGKLVLEKATLTSDYKYSVELQNSEVYANSSALGNAAVSGSAIAFKLRNSTFNTSLLLQSTDILFSNTVFTTEILEFHGRAYAENTSFDRALSFNDADNITLVAVNLPETPDAILAHQQAIVKIYRYLDIFLTDLNNAGLDGAMVNVYDIQMNQVASSTTANGTTRFVLPTDIVDATTPYYSNFVGVYIVNIAFGSGYWYNITMPCYYSWQKGLEITETIPAAPDVAVSFATTFPTLVPYGAIMNGTIKVENLGTSRAENLLVEIYDGLETVFSDRITVLAGGSQQINFAYTAHLTGYRTLILVADPGSEITETSKENNAATMEFIVYNPGSMLLIENTTVEISNTTAYQYGSILIGFNGTLILDNATLILTQPTAYAYGIYIYSDGTLIMKNSQIQGNYPYYFVTIENATVSAANSRITTISVLGTQNCKYLLFNTKFTDATLNISASEFTMIGGSLIEGFWQSIAISAVKFYLQDIYCPFQIVLAPNASAVLVNTTLSGGVDDIITADGAEAWIYRYLDVLALDGNKNPLDSVNITVSFASNGTIADTLLTDLYGNARFVLLTDIVNYSIQSIGGTSFFVGNYKVIAEFAGENQSASISFEAYPSTVNVVKLNLTYTAQVPDFAVSTGDIKVPATFDYYSGGTVNITVRNIGPRNGINVTIVVYDLNLDANTETEINRTVINILSGDVIYLSIQWLPSLPGNHSIKVEIDPINLFNETSKANNIAISQGVWFNPSIEIIGLNISKDALPYDENVYINLTVKNTGNVNMTNFEVVLEDTYLHQSFREFITSLNANQSVNVSFNYLVASPGNHIVNLRVEVDRVYDAETFVLKVYSPPDLEVDTNNIQILFGNTPVYKAMEDTPLTINVTIANLADTPAHNVTVEIYNDTYLIASVVIPNIPALSTTEISIPWNASMPGRILVSVLRCEQPYLEKNTANNNAEKLIEVIPLPDIQILDFYAEKNGNKTVNFTAGDTAILWLNISNSVNYAIENFSLEIFAGNISDENLIVSANLSIDANSTLTTNFTWIVHLDSNTSLYAVLNRNHTIVEKNYTNNMLDLNLTIISAKLLISIAQLPLTFNIDDTPVVSGQILREATGEGIQGINVNVVMFLNDDIVYQQAVTTDQNGNFTVTLIQLKEPGQYRVVVSCPDYPDVEVSSTLFSVEKPVPPPQFPWLMVIIAIIAVVGVSLAVVFLYFRRAAGKLVECGECGAYIPENATKCPKCGTEFEVTTVKCSECGAWIDGKATVCPECGTVFTGKKVEAESYEEMMRKEFNAYVEKFKTEAKKELGKEYSESAFWAWWKNKPTYRTYTQWLKEEELKKKGALKCPQCTTLNEKTAKVCLKCGSSLEGAELVQSEKLPGVKRVEISKEEEKVGKAEEKGPTPQKIEEPKKTVQPTAPPAQVPPVKQAEAQKQPPIPQAPPKPQVPLPPKPSEPKEEMPTLPIRGAPPSSPEQQQPEKAVLEFKPEQASPGAPKVVVIRKPTAAKVVIPKKVIRKPMAPGQEGEAQEIQGEESRDKQQQP